MNRTRTVAGSMAVAACGVTALTVLSASGATSAPTEHPGANRVAKAAATTEAPRSPDAATRTRDPGTARTPTPPPRPDSQRPVRPLRVPATGVLDRPKASTILHTILGRPTSTLRTTGEVTTVFSGLTTGRFLTELKAQQGELQENGWTQRGTPKVVSATVTNQTATTATVTACLDQSAVAVLDADGRSVGTSDVPRAKHIYDFTRAPGGEWRITTHRFPVDPAC